LVQTWCWLHQARTGVVLAASGHNWPGAGAIRPVLARCWQHQAGTGMVLAASGR